jgi:hypothetical protein
LILFVVFNLWIGSISPSPSAIQRRIAHKEIPD